MLFFALRARTIARPPSNSVIPATAEVAFISGALTGTGWQPLSSLSWSDHLHVSLADAAPAIATNNTAKPIDFVTGPTSILNQSRVHTLPRNVVNQEHVCVRYQFKFNRKCDGSRRFASSAGITKLLLRSALLVICELQTSFHLGLRSFLPFWDVIIRFALTDGLTR